MHTEEALKYLKTMDGVGSPSKYDEALEMAIKALELQGELVRNLSHILDMCGHWNITGGNILECYELLAKAGVQS
jgi:hypothetical protein